MIKHPDPYVASYLMASTGNITKECAAALDRYCERTPGVMLKEFGVPVTFEKGEYGWFVHVPEDNDGILFDELIVVLDHARKRGCRWIEFDCDNEPIEGLSTFNW